MKPYNREMTDEKRLEQEIERAQSLITNTFLVPTKTCRSCGSRALVKDGQLEGDGGQGMMGSAVVPEITICLDEHENCGKVRARRVPQLPDIPWHYGTQRVEFTDGPSFVQISLPQKITTKQRARLMDFLANPVLQPAT